MSAAKALVVLIVATLGFGCASSGKSGPAPPDQNAALGDWSNAEGLRVGTPVRVTEQDGDKSYGRVMVVTNLRLTLELVDGSKTIPREVIALIERFPTSVPASLPNAAVGVGAALTLSSSSTPDTYRRNIVTGHEAFEKGSIPISNGYYVDAVGLVGRSIEMVYKAIESSRTTVVVYRR